MLNVEWIQPSPPPQHSALLDTSLNNYNYSPMTNNPYVWVLQLNFRIYRKYEYKYSTCTELFYVQVHSSRVYVRNIRYNNTIM